MTYNEQTPNLRQGGLAATKWLSLLLVALAFVCLQPARLAAAQAQTETVEGQQETATESEETDSEPAAESDTQSDTPEESSDGQDEPQQDSDEKSGKNSDTNTDTEETKKPVEQNDEVSKEESPPAEAKENSEADGAMEPVTEPAEDTPAKPADTKEAEAAEPEAKAEPAAQESEAKEPEAKTEEPKADPEPEAQPEEPVEAERPMEVEVPEEKAKPTEETSGPAQVKNPETKKCIIGSTATLLEKQSGLKFHARVDTGAKSCSLHVEKMNIQDESTKENIRARMTENIGKVISFVVKNSDGKTHILKRKIAGYVIIRTSDKKEGKRRYKVPLTLLWKNTEKEVLVTLNDRQHMEYPLLIGRNFLRGDFLVDVELDNDD